MAGENTATTTVVTNENAGGAATVDPNADKTKTGSATTAQATAKTETPPEPRQLGDEDEPKPGERIVLSSEAMAKRMARANKAHLRELFGTDDPAALKGQLSKLQALEQEEEKRRQAALTKEQQLEERATTAERRAQEAEQRAIEAQDAREVDEFESDAKEELKDVIKPKFWRHVRTDLAEHLVSEYGDNLESMSAKDRADALRKWAADYVKENPEYAVEKPKEETTTTAAVAKPALQNGVANPSGKKPAPAASTQETGRVDVRKMNAVEYAAWKRQNNLNY